MPRSEKGFSSIAGEVLNHSKLHGSDLRFSNYITGDDGLDPNAERPPRGASPQAVARAAEFFRFLRRVKRPSAPRPEANSGSAPGSGTAEMLPMTMKSS